MTSLAGTGATNFALYNSKEAQPLEPGYVHFPSAVQLMHDSQGKIFPAALASLKSFDGLGDMLHLFKIKIDGLFMWFEAPNNMSYYLFISASLARFRVPFVMLMSILAAFFLIDFAQHLLAVKRKEILAAVSLACLAWFYTGNILDKYFFAYYPNDIITVYTTHYKDRLLALEKSGDNEAFAATTTDLMRYIPDFFMQVRGNHRASSSNEAKCCRSVSNLLKMHAAALKATGKESGYVKFGDQAKTLSNIFEEFSRRTGMQ